MVLLKMERHRDKIIKTEPNFQIKNELSDVDLLYLDYTSINPRLNEEQLSREIKSEPWIDIADYMKSQMSTIAEEVDVPSLKAIKTEIERYTDSPALVSDKDVLMLDYKPILPNYQPPSFENSTINIQSQNRFLFPFDVKHGCQVDTRTPTKNQEKGSQAEVNREVFIKREILSPEASQTYVNKENSVRCSDRSTGMALNPEQPINESSRRQDCCYDRTFSTDKQTELVQNKILTSVDTQMDVNENMLPRVCLERCDGTVKPVKQVRKTLEDIETLNHQTNLRPLSSGLVNDQERRILDILAQAVNMVKEQERNAGQHKSSKTSSDVKRSSNRHVIFADIRQVKTYSRGPKAHRGISTQSNLDGVDPENGGKGGVNGGTGGVNDRDYRTKPNHYSSKMPSSNTGTPISANSRVDTSQENVVCNRIEALTSANSRVDEIPYLQRNNSSVQNPTSTGASVMAQGGLNVLHSTKYKTPDVQEIRGHNSAENMGKNSLDVQEIRGVNSAENRGKNSLGLQEIRGHNSAENMGNNSLDVQEIRGVNSAENKGKNSLDVQEIRGVNSVENMGKNSLNVQEIRGHNSQQKRKSAVRAMDKLSQLDDDVIDDDTDPSYIGDESVSPSTAKSKSSNGSYRDLLNGLDSISARTVSKERLHALAIQNYLFHKMQTLPELSNYTTMTNVKKLSSPSDCSSRSQTVKELLKENRSRPTVNELPRRKTSVPTVAALLKRKRSDSGEMDNSISKRHCPNFIQAKFNVENSSNKAAPMGDNPSSMRNQEFTTSLTSTDLPGQMSSKQMVNPSEVLELRGHNSQSSILRENCFDVTDLNGCNSSYMPNESLDLQSSNSSFQNPTSAGVSFVALGRINSSNLTRDNTPDVQEIRGHNSAENLGKNSLDVQEIRGHNSAENRGKNSLNVQEIRKHNSAENRGKNSLDVQEIRGVNSAENIEKNSSDTPDIIEINNTSSDLNSLPVYNRTTIVPKTKGRLHCKSTIRRLLADDDALGIFYSKKEKKIPKLPCEFCERTFLTEYNRNVHTEAAHKTEKSCICEICGQKCENNTKFQAHMYNHTKRFTCDICNTQWSTTYNLKTHMLSHTGEKPHKCELCEKSFSRIDNLVLHLKLMHKDVDVLPYACKDKDCHKKFKTSKEKQVHFKSVHGLSRESKTLVKCDLCEMTLPNRPKNWMNHKKHHEQGRVFTCQLCNKSMLLTLRKNIACDIKEGDNMKKSCFPCFKNWAKENHSIYMAELLITDVMQTLQCKICLKKFFAPKSLEEHMWKEHRVREQKAS